MRAASYLRVSTDRQTVENQRAAVRAMLKPWLDVTGGTPTHREVSVEEVESGAKNRPKLRELINSLRSGDVLAVWALDRLGRNAVETIVNVKGLLSRGVLLRSVSEPWIVQDGIARDLLVMVFAWVAEVELAKLKERTRAGVATARAAGKRLGRPPADPAVLDRMKMLVESGRSWAQAARDCGVSRSTSKRLRAASRAVRP